MPPKKDAAPEKKVLWGRPGNTLKMGIVGLPNVGKSTTFNLLSKLTVPAENYPFCTIEPNLAKVHVHDPRFDKLVEMWKPKSQVTATLSILDIAGLVPGASKGEGLGNNFLSHIREVDGIYHVLRAFENPEIIHTENEVDPIRDLKIISDELRFKDIEIADKRLEECLHKINKQNDKSAKAEKELLDKVKTILESGKWIRQEDWSAKDVEELNKHLFLTAKPVVYLVNLSAEDFKRKKNKFLGKIAEWVKANINGPVIPYSCEYELAVFEEQENSKKEKEKKEPEETKEPIKDSKPLTDISMLPKIIKIGYQILDLIYFFTAGHDEVKCWTIREGTKAPGAAGTIHTDFEQGFICAEVMKYDDFVRCGNEAAVKAEGKYRQQGKEYVVEDGDICFFKFNAPFKGKK